MDSTTQVADIFGAFGEAYRQAHGHQMPIRHFRAMRAIQACRTAALGGHVEACDACGHIRISYNSCRNRHCPKCQALNKERWLEAQKADLLPVPYFHVVFTLPEDLHPIALRNQRIVYNLLFEAASQTLIQLSRDPAHLGAQIGFTTILHTWSQTLMDHPHLHCVVTGGGLSPDGQKWIATQKGFFLPVRVISRLFRGKFLALLKQAFSNGKLAFPGQIESKQTPSAFQCLLTGLYHKDWNVYCKPPFGSPHQVIDYLGRYTHRVAISNNRILGLDGDQVSFRYRDYADGDRIKTMSLHAFEFIRRFLLHILPERFVRIRHYGILTNRNRHTKLNRCKTLLGIQEQDPPTHRPCLAWQELLYRLTGVDPTICPHCGKGRMIPTEVLMSNRSPP